MNKLSSKPVIVVAGVLVVVLAFVGGLLVAKSRSSDQASAAAPTETGADAGGSSTSSTVSPSASVDGAGAAAGGSTGAGSGSGVGGGEVADPSAVVPVESASGASYAYQETENGQSATGTIPPPTLPVKVSMSSTSGLHDGDPVTIRAEAIDGSQVFGFDVRICRADASFRVLYDFYPQVSPQCALDPLSPNSDAFVRVASDGAAQVAEGAFRVGTGSEDMTSVDGVKGTVTCDHDHPCKLVLMLQVPYGFGFQEFPLSFA